MLHGSPHAPDLRHLLLCLFWLLAALPARAEPQAVSLATLIIDDLGYARYWGERVTALPGEITCAVLPHVPHSEKLARLAHQSGKEVILHAPMSNRQGRPLGPGAMTAEMTELELLSKLLWNLASVPHARGLNNHMGSLLTQQEQPMRWIMREAKRNGLFFIDSRTTGGSKAPELALKYEVPFAVRDVFLDHDRDPREISRAFDKWTRIARTRGHAVAIGHPYPETVEFLEQNLPRLAELGIRLIPASEMARLRLAATLALRDTEASQQASIRETSLRESN